MFRGGKIPDHKPHMSLRELAEDLDNHVKKEVHEFINPKCHTCGSDLKLGDFAYDQNMCWDCFKKRVEGIAQRARTPMEAEMILHLLKITEEVYRRKLK